MTWSASTQIVLKIEKSVKEQCREILRLDLTSRCWRPGIFLHVCKANKFTIQSDVIVHHLVTTQTLICHYEHAQALEHPAKQYMGMIFTAGHRSRRFVTSYLKNPFICEKETHYLCIDKLFSKSTSLRGMVRHFLMQQNSNSSVTLNQHFVLQIHSKPS